MPPPPLTITIISTLPPTHLLSFLYFTSYILYLFHTISPFLSLHLNKPPPLHTSPPLPASLPIFSCCRDWSVSPQFRPPAFIFLSTSLLSVQNTTGTTLCPEGASWETLSHMLREEMKGGGGRRQKHNTYVRKKDGRKKQEKLESVAQRRRGGTGAMQGKWKKQTILKNKDERQYLRMRIKGGEKWKYKWFNTKKAKNG